MADKIYLNTRFGYREDTLSEWERINPVLERGEISLVRNGEEGNFLKIGDGVTRWVDLPYTRLPKGDKGDRGDKGDKGDKGERGEDGLDGQDAVIDREYSPESANAQSGTAVAEGISSAAEWESLVDITLTEEQAGVSAVNVEVDKAKLLNFTRYFLYFAFTAPQDLSANSLWLSATIEDIVTQKYHYVFGSPNGPITAASQGSTIYGFCEITWLDDAVRATSTNLNIHQNANSRTSSIVTNTAIKPKANLNGAQPYLLLCAAGIAFPAGTHIVLKGRR